MQPAEIFRGAADLIAAEGHTKRALRDRNGYCLVGAILAVDPKSVWLSTWRSFFYPLLLSEIRDHQIGNQRAIVHGMSIWNDHPATTKEDVIEVLLRAAKRAENQSPQLEGVHSGRTDQDSVD